MTSASDYGWHPDRPCPEWCVTGAQHLDHALAKQVSDIWHEGPIVELPTQETDHNWHPIPAQARLVQREQVDERGHHRRPAEITVDETRVTPKQARQWAAHLESLASVAVVALESDPAGLLVDICPTCGGQVRERTTDLSDTSDRLRFKVTRTCEDCGRREEAATE